MTPSDPNDGDRWLREALRHAPDADRPVPDSVAETILRAARTQTARPRPAEAVPPRARRWAWLDALGRPQNAGALTSLLRATASPS